MLAVYLGWLVLVTTIFVPPYVFTLGNILLQDRFSHLRHSIATAAELAALWTIEQINVDPMDSMTPQSPKHPSSSKDHPQFCQLERIGVRHSVPQTSSQNCIHLKPCNAFSCFGGRLLSLLRSSSWYSPLLGSPRHGCSKGLPPSKFCYRPTAS